ncbi:LysR family transcriptional regulator [Alcaligenaceae bacterium]|nr:LysR family transcriptional regulator [Alcaligenaceae bacterium]
MDKRKLQCFVSVFEKGSVSAAAEALHMTQPPLSVMIRKLEDDLGVSLFNREANRLLPTPTGELFYRRAKELLTSMNAIHRELDESHNGSRGTVRVGCSTAASLFLIPAAMQEIADSKLNITVHVQEGETAYLVQRLRDGHLDLAICRSQYIAADIETCAVKTESLVVALPPGHPLASNASIRIADLKHETFFLHSAPSGRGISDTLIAACHAEGYSPKVAYWGIETLPMLLMVQRGLGIAFAPASFGELGLSGMPKLVPLRDPEIHTHLNLITLKQARTPATVQRFMGLINRV